MKPIIKHLLSGVLSAAMAIVEIFVQMAILRLTAL